jgi:hypothetical protein
MNLLGLDNYTNILINCDIKSTISFISCCKSMKNILNNNLLWKSMVMRDYEHFEYDNHITWYNLYKILFENEIFIKKRANIFYINKGKFILKCENRNVELIVIDNDFCIENKIKEGDIIAIIDKYENIGNKYIYESNQRAYSFDCDNIIIIPGKLYNINEFPPNYWKDQLKYNNPLLINDDNHLRQIHNNMKMYMIRDSEIEGWNGVLIISKVKVIKSYFIVNYIKYYIIITSSISHINFKYIDINRILKKNLFYHKPFDINDNCKLIVKDRTIFISIESYEDCYNDETIEKIKSLDDDDNIFNEKDETEFIIYN